MVTIKHTRESIAELERERDQYKRERDESNKEVVRVMEKLIVSEDTAEDYKFGYREIKKQRDELIKDIEKSRVLNEQLIFEIRHYEYVIKSLRLEVDNYNTLTEHIRDKAEHNPSVSRYKDLVHFIDDLERE